MWQVRPAARLHPPREDHRRHPRARVRHEPLGDLAWRAPGPPCRSSPPAGSPTACILRTWPRVRIFAQPWEAEAATADIVPHSPRLRPRGLLLPGGLGPRLHPRERAPAMSTICTTPSRRSGSSPPRRATYGSSLTSTFSRTRTRSRRPSVSRRSTRSPVSRDPRRRRGTSRGRVPDLGIDFTRAASCRRGDRRDRPRRFATSSRTCRPHVDDS